MATNIVARRSTGSTLPRTHTDFNPSASFKVKSFPGLVGAAFQAKKGKELFLHMVAQSLQSDVGCNGFFSINYAVDQATNILNIVNSIYISLY